MRTDYPRLSAGGMFPILAGEHDPTKDILQQYKFDHIFSFVINIEICNSAIFIGNTHKNVYNIIQNRLVCMQQVY